jgi:hypothetical protein
MELGLGLQLVESVSSTIGVGFIDCGSALFVVAGFRDLEIPQSSGLAVHSPTIVRARSPHGGQDMGVEKEMSVEG